MHGLRITAQEVATDCALHVTRGLVGTRRVDLHRTHAPSSTRRLEALSPRTRSPRTHASR